MYAQVISVIDMDGLSMFGGDSRFYKALGKSSEMSALYYPQVLGRCTQMTFKIPILFTDLIY